MEDRLQTSRNYWNAFADKFVMFDSVMKQAWSTILLHLELSTASNVLEVGCGRGECAKAILNSLPSNAKLTATDLSPEMISKAKEALSSTSNVSLKVMNACELEGIQSASTDRYIANMTLHLVPEPEKMLKEARRVLKSGGIAGFSIWGSPENSPMMQERDSNNFALGRDIPKLKDMFKSAGFTQVVIWRQECVLELWNAERAVQFWAIVQERQKETHLTWYNNLLNSFQKVIDRNEPIGLEALIILAK